MNRMQPSLPFAVPGWWEGGRGIENEGLKFRSGKTKRLGKAVLSGVFVSHKPTLFFFNWQ